jgi:hypothetical protein
MGIMSRTAPGPTTAWQRTLGLALPLLASCGADGSCGESVLALTGGGAQESYLGLSEGQQAAIVEITATALGVEGRCSGALVAPGWVLTAGHCAPLLSAVDLVIRTGFGPAARSAGAETHPSLDVGILPVKPVPGVEAIARTDEPFTADWIGRRVEIAGWGRTETGEMGQLRWAVAEIEDITAVEVAVLGPESGGTCAGDSGGPLLVRGADGGVRVAGALSSGSLSCEGASRYVRLDVAAEWLAGRTGAYTPPIGCGTLDGSGRCFGDRAVWCEGGDARAADCLSPQACGWDVVAQGYRCVADDPCAGVDDLGTCQEDTAVHCERGQAQGAACAACGQTCGIDGASGRATCGN